MSRYYLTEAYGDLYNPRKADETFYRNLKFVDYLQTEEIEEVMESLLWEFMDYGNTLDESYDLIEGVFSDDILEEVLCEAKVTFGGKASERVTTGIGGSAGIGKSRKVTVGRRGPSVGSGESSKVTFGSGKEPRTQSRIARVTGAAKKAKDTVVSAASGLGKNTMSTLKRGKGAAVGSYERAKGTAGTAMAALKGLVRKGVFAVGSKMRQAGEKIEKSGKEAASAPAVTRSANIGGRRHTYVSEPTPETGRKRRAIGSTIKRIADRLIKSGAERTPLPPRTHLTSASRVPSTLPDPWYTQTKLASRPSRSSTSSRPPAPTRKALPPGRSLGLRSLGKGGPSKEISFSRHAQKRVVPIGSNKKELEGSARDVSIRAARRRAQMAEELELITQKILDDLISEGYADNIDNAATILENLSDEVIENLISEYLN